MSSQAISSHRQHIYAWALTLGFALVAQPPAARADDDRLRLFDDPIAYTDVVDAVDGDDPFDLNVQVAFRRSRTAGTIQRELTGAGLPTPGRGSANFGDVADWEHIRNVLEVGLDMGIYRDVMIFARLPLVLSDTRELVYAGSDTATIDSLLSTDVPGMGPTPLFGLPFQSPTRSGIDSVNVGVAFNLMNQARRRDRPTWLMMFEGRFGVGSIMAPCADGEANCDPGVSPGTHSVRFESRLSRRYPLAELYQGIAYEFAWAGRAKDQYTPSGNLSGYQNRRPPMRGTLTAGVAFIPWENRATWQRFTLDLRGRATYVSEGRDYSPLFDALGSSSNPYLALPNLEGIPNGSAALRQVPFNGLTDVQDHGELGGSVAIEMQAARYIRFRFGVDVDYITPHFLSASDACNPNASANGPDDPRQGTCTEGLINPHYRVAIDLPGQRFRLDSGLRLNLFVQATAQF